MPSQTSNTYISVRYSQAKSLYILEYTHAQQGAKCQGETSAKELAKGPGLYTERVIRRKVQSIFSRHGLGRGDCDI